MRLKYAFTCLSRSRNCVKIRQSLPPGVISLSFGIDVRSCRCSCPRRMKDSQHATCQPCGRLPSYQRRQGLPVTHPTANKPYYTTVRWSWQAWWLARDAMRRGPIVRRRGAAACSAAALRVLDTIGYVTTPAPVRASGAIDRPSPASRPGQVRVRSKCASAFEQGLAGGRHAADDNTSITTHSQGHHPDAGRVRMLPATKSQPKEMLPVARKPMINTVEEMVPPIRPC